MLRSMSAREFSEWMVFDELEPIGNDRVDFLMGSIVQIIANVNRGKARKNRPFTLDECTPVFGDRPPLNVKSSEQAARNWQSMKSLAKALSESSKPKRKKALVENEAPPMSKTARQHALELLEQLKGKK